MYELKKKW